MRWEAGTMIHLYKNFVSDHAMIMKRNWGDQDWIMKAARDDITHWPDDWIRSYKWELVGFKDTKLLSKDGKSYFRTPAKIEKGNKVAVFHGLPNPMQCSDPFVVENWR